jgi:hypothetical protein
MDVPSAKGKGSMWPFKVPAGDAKIHPVIGHPKSKSFDDPERDEVVRYRSFHYH